MAKVNKKAMIVGVGVVSAAGLAGSAFAASISTTDGNAGQGAVVVSGYSAGAVTYNGGWTNTAASSGTTTVSSFTFTLTKTGGGSISSSDTVVYAQLTGGTAGNWTACVVGSANAVTCTPTGTAKELSTVAGVNIVAYDA